MAGGFIMIKRDLSAIKYVIKPLTKYINLSYNNG